MLNGQIVKKKSSSVSIAAFMIDGFGRYINRFQKVTSLKLILYLDVVGRVVKA